ncbi:MAG: class I SAM-dependent methyltransferase [Anaerolineae bacterium]|nr:class I SAM-dependent methyltransferase [Anaerolineae bacterium]MBT7072406.1 class I SAM-dependent methyltransferase [Anaerolineae bacterium]MBT7326244.1 class I SAM-dependent methyltransferase [Anaerolineae bacterium]
MSNDEIVYGNYEDKYNATNPISKMLMRGFLRAFHNNLHNLPTDLQSICEVGCGEGELLKRLHTRFPQALLSATDLSPDEVDEAKTNCAGIPINFSVQNAQQLDAYADSSFDLVVCCEVLEHLPDPERGLHELWRISSKYVLVSVPNEPIWRMLNLARGKYIRHWGNTPGHLNHWTILQFPKFLQNTPFTPVKESYPLPWQMVLLEKR